MSKMEDTTKETKNLGIDFTVEPVLCSIMLRCGKRIIPFSAVTT